MQTLIIVAVVLSAALVGGVIFVNRPKKSPPKIKPMDPVDRELSERRSQGTRSPVGRTELKPVPLMEAQRKISEPSRNDKTRLSDRNYALESRQREQRKIQVDESLKARNDSPFTSSARPVWMDPMPMISNSDVPEFNGFSDDGGSSFSGGGGSFGAGGSSGSWDDSSSSSSDSGSSSSDSGSSSSSSD